MKNKRNYKMDFLEKNEKSPVGRTDRGKELLLGVGDVVSLAPSLVFCRQLVLSIQLLSTQSGFATELIRQFAGTTFLRHGQRLVVSQRHTLRVFVNNSTSLGHSSFPPYYWYIAEISNNDFESSTFFNPMYSRIL